MAAYSVAKIKFKCANVVFIAFLLSMMLPIQATIIPTYIVMSKLHLVNTLFALIDGTVKFERMGKDRKKVSVYAVEQ